MEPLMPILEFALKQTPLAAVLMFIAYRFYKDKSASDAIVLGLVEKCVTALNNNTSAVTELRRVVEDLQVEVTHTNANSATQQMAPVSGHHGRPAA